MVQKLISILLFGAFCGLLANAAPIDSINNSAANGNSAGPKSAMMGFQEWKKNRVFDAKLNLDKFKSPQLSKQAENAKNSKDSDESVENSEEKANNSKTQTPNQELADSLPKPGEASDKEPAVAKELSPEDQATLAKKTAQEAEKLRQLEFNMEIAQGLTIHDYFALYLKNKNPKEMAEAIKQLSPEELSELLLAYRKALYGAPSSVQKEKPVAPKSL